MHYNNIVMPTREYVLMGKPTIFFSHSSKDKEAILKIKNKLDMATGGVLGLEKAKKGAKRFDQMGQDPKILQAYAENAKKIADVKGKIKEIEDLDGLDLKGYSAQTYNGSAFPNASSGNGSKGSSGKSSAQKVQEDMEKLSDRYWDLNNAISKCESELKKFNTQMEHATDDQKISGLNKQLELLDKQRDAYKKLREEQQKDL